MKLPGMSFLREQQAVKAFEALEPAFREVVFYSEGAGDWPHIGPVVEALLRDHDRKMSYLTSDANDPGLRIDDPRLRAFNIGAGTARTVLFARIDCRTFVMTLPDLGNLWLKRSVHPVHYVYLFHSMNSTHTSYRTGAFDNFDTILCVGRHHVEEIRKTEQVYGLRVKELIEHGSVKLDAILAEVAGMPKRDPNEVPEVLVAPTWGESSLIEQPMGRHLVDVLVEAGYRTVLRLHPMTSRRVPKLVAELRRAYGNHERFSLELDMSATQSWLRSDVMISDWSGAATEYAFALLKPVVYIDTPPKIMNPEWGRISMPSFEESVRRQVGVVVNPAQMDEIPALAARAIADRRTVSERARQARDGHVFNADKSSAVAAAYLNGS